MLTKPPWPCFNPRAREGRDGNNHQLPLVQKGFNPRAREGRDLYEGNVFARAYVFQSTRPRGARHNPDSVSSVRGTVSIHAPARGATLLQTQK